ncbi:MAG: methyltransferase domain-containing protein, partial [Caldilineaceae bacterium]
MEPIELLTLNSEAVRSEVSAYYADRVRSQTSCCGTGAGESCTAYGADELALIPEESAAISYGCGNPGAIAALQAGEIVLDLGSGGGIDCFLAADRVGPAGYVYGVDMTDEM